MADVRLTREVEIPDALRIARAKASPGFGPRLLFFSGGSALNEISRRLKSYTHNSAHLITPFDSGGSSQVLREAFDMPAVGDLRSRLMALADETELGQPDIYSLFTRRLPADASHAELEGEFRALLAGEHPLIRAVSQPMRGLILRPLRCLGENLPPDFDLRRASVGNLILAGGYLANEHELEPVLFLMSKMVAVRGTVRAIADVNLQVGAELEDGSVVVGQRFLTGKEHPPLDRPIRRLFLSDGVCELGSDEVRLPERNRKLVEKADLICYPPGSLYTSVIANLLPRGVGAAVAARSVPKVYVPSLGQDPECVGMTLSDRVAALLEAMRRDAGRDCPTEHLLNLVLCDRQTLSVGDVRDLRDRFGVACVATDLTGDVGSDRYDPARVCNALISLA